MITEVKERTLEQMFDDEMQIRAEGENNFPLANKKISVVVKYEPSKDRLVAIRDEWRPGSWDLIIPQPYVGKMPF